MIGDSSIQNRAKLLFGIGSVSISLFLLAASLNSIGAWLSKLDNAVLSSRTRWPGLEFLTRFPVRVIENELSSTLDQIPSCDLYWTDDVAAAENSREGYASKQIVPPRIRRQTKIRVSKLSFIDVSWATVITGTVRCPNNYDPDRFFISGRNECAGFVPFCG